MWFEGVIHDIIGEMASYEGLPYMLRDAQNRFLKENAVFQGYIVPRPRSVGKVIGRKIGRRSQDNKNLNHDNFLIPIFGLHSSYYPSSSKSFSVGNLADEGRKC